MVSLKGVSLSCTFQAEFQDSLLFSGGLKADPDSLQLHSATSQYSGSANCCGKSRQTFFFFFASSVSGQVLTGNKDEGPLPGFVVLVRLKTCYEIKASWPTFLHVGRLMGQELNTRSRTKV